MLPSDVIITVTLEVEVPQDSKQQSWDQNPALCEGPRPHACHCTQLVTVEGKDGITDRSLCKTKVLYTGVLL